MDLKPVQSSAIAAVGHDPATETLYVRFHSRREPYLFAPVSTDEHEAFVNADSLGAHFHRHIKGRDAKAA
jgi:KTSC domain